LILAHLSFCVYYCSGAHVSRSWFLLGGGGAPFKSYVCSCNLVVSGF
jgi:hypothetical protein